MLYHVRHGRVVDRLDQRGEMISPKTRLPGTAAVVLVLVQVLAQAPARAGNLPLSPEAARALDQTYSGDPDAAIATAQSIEHSQPASPVGYLLEAEARWWKMYCVSCEIKWGMLDAWKRPKQAQDDTYFALADKAISLARAQIARSDTAEQQVYVALGFALKARLYSLRDEKRAVAHAGVAARAACLRALELDPDTADATAMLGLYNYYIDTLSSIAKMLRFFMGIPGGKKEDGIRQMRTAMESGQFLAVDTRFYLAKNLRTYDQRYDQAVEVAEPLVARYPENPVFLLLLGNLDVELGRDRKAAEYFRSAQSAAVSDLACATRSRELADISLAALH
jgi:tetratricopeptide (TPR) repeat protein